MTVAARPVQQEDRIVATGAELAVGFVRDPQFRHHGAVFESEVVDVENLRFGARRASNANRQRASQKSLQIAARVCLVKILFDSGIAPQLELTSTLLDEQPPMRMLRSAYLARVLADSARAETILALLLWSGVTVFIFGILIDWFR